MTQEIEGKWRVDDLGTVRERVRALGGEPGGVREERNLLFTAPGVPLLGKECTLRLRILDDGRGFLTFKGPRDPTRTLKTRPESETGVDAPEATRTILEALGFRAGLEYAKTREIWRLPDVEVALDTFYGESYVEVEGPEEEVVRVAIALGLRLDRMDHEAYANKKAAMGRGGANHDPGRGTGD
jgi:predicted adenylyl cyclase CyaB